MDKGVHQYDHINFLNCVVLFVFAGFTLRRRAAVHRLFRRPVLF